MKESNVSSVQGSGMFKELYVFEVEMQNGDVGKIYRKTEDPKLKEGELIKYTMNDKGSIKIQTDYQGGGGYKKDDNVQKMIVKQSTLKCAVDFVIAKNGTSEDVTTLATKWYDYIMEKGSNKGPF
ncbi:MAG: hypothetical protein Tp1124DCM108671_42 [Prokaryotic dsDNA virus sp.]|mgnify:CR=1 FL=1|nr:MAG: hypothetical protein Tp1125DCM102451_13 [Prokaryotic dsDNA virus sp.]QDP65599.1 MAG: hypothetical protein Tp1124DCM108671_42 [Prokaryotic dsDNA virus sp.]|tara:strand:- start:25662 stop:26036 length:375 start_codon:yes stop_codon:yes gene_type:complete